MFNKDIGLIDFVVFDVPLPILDISMILLSKDFVPAPLFTYLLTV